MRVDQKQLYLASENSVDVVKYRNGALCVDRKTAGPSRTGRVLNVYRLTEKYRD